MTGVPALTLPTAVQIYSIWVLITPILYIDAKPLLATFALMQAFAERLQKRTQELGLSHVEVARRADLAPRRYANYVRGDREPDLATLVKIARVLATTPDALLGFSEGEDLNGTAELMGRLVSSARVLSSTELETVVIQVDALARRRLE